MNTWQQWLGWLRCKRWLSAGLLIGNVTTLVCTMLWPASFHRFVAKWATVARVEARAFHRLAWQVAMPLTTPKPLPRAIRMDAPTTLPDIVLINGHIDAFPLRQLQGSAVLMGFGATNCLIATCPNLLTQFQEVKRYLGSDTSKLRFVVIGVDVHHDTPASLIRFVRSYDPDFMALTGDEKTILRFAAQHGIWTPKYTTTSTPRFIPRGAHTLFINPQGQWTLSFPNGMPPAEIADAIRLELNP